ncbi:transposable element Tc1 transposase [Trichonephila clavipes]|nr:transposable element Tc1 transposase [Trichonephila clavipes]
MSSRHHIDDFMRGRIIGKIEERRKITDVAREFDIAHSVVSRLWKSFKTTGMCSRRHGGGRVRRGGLYARRPVVCVPLTRQHRTARLQWCREHHNWTEQDWACVLFSESRFSLSLDCRRQLIWRESGTAYRPENIQEKDQYPTCSIMVWGRHHDQWPHAPTCGCEWDYDGQRYIDEVLLPHVRLFRCCRQVAGRNYPPTNKNTLIRAPTEEWDKLPQQLLDNVAQKMIAIFNPFGSDGKIIVYRKRNAKLEEQNTVSTVKHGGGCSMVWGCMAASELGNIAVINGIMDHLHYIQILKENVRASDEKLRIEEDYQIYKEMSPNTPLKIQDYDCYTTASKL